MGDTLRTPLTEMFHIKRPIMLAGMNVAAGPELAAAVSNAGGMGVIGGVGYTPKVLRKTIAELKSFLKDKDAPFGVDLLLPQVGGNARKTNSDYTKGQLPELIDIIIEEKAKLFVSAVGVPPEWAVQKLHKAGILVANMIGHPKHELKALDVGVDIIIAQGGEGGGHTGDIATSILIPMTVDAVRGRMSPMTGKQVAVVAAGGIFDGRGLASALMMGACGVWVGTRFIVSKEAGAPPRHQQAVLKAGLQDTVRTVIYTGRPMRVLKTPYIDNWETNRANDIRALTGKGILPVQHDLQERADAGKEINFQEQLEMTPLLMGQCAGAIEGDIPTAAQIMDEMIGSAIKVIKGGAGMVARL